MTAAILCVDDEPNNLHILRQILKDDHPLVFARSGAGAVAAVAKYQPALVLLDVDMPDIDGYSVCRKLKSNPVTEHIPVIFVTHFTDEGHERAGFEAGGVDYITKPVSSMVVQARVRTHLSLVRAARLEESYRDAIYMLGEAGHFSDADTGAHIWRMAAFSRALAETLGWSGERLNLIELAAPMHDMGKIGIPDAILKKPGSLNTDEWDIMKTHTRIGHDILSRSRAPVFQMAAEIALYHHERWDGTGYPEGLSGTDIPESARIVAVADVFDALVNKRPYKDPWEVERALDTLTASVGTHLEARVVEAFHDILPLILTIKDHWEEQERATVAQIAPPSFTPSALAKASASH